ncbi:MAG: hypothetical protein WB661_11075 [Candidatus Bathyarchaeia archaeon]
MKATSATSDDIQTFAGRLTEEGIHGFISKTFTKEEVISEGLDIVDTIAIVLRNSSNGIIVEKTRESWLRSARRANPANKSFTSTKIFNGAGRNQACRSQNSARPVFALIVSKNE